MYQNLKASLVKQLEIDLHDVNMVGFTSDGWEASNMKCFLALTAHYVTRNFDYKSVLLDCRAYAQRHTGPQIALVMDNIMEDFSILTSDHIKKICTTDGATNMNSALKKSKYMDSQIVCVAHLLNNTIREAVEKNVVLYNCVDQCKGLVSRLHTSKLDLSHVEEACETLKGIQNNSNTLWVTRS